MITSIARQSVILKCLRKKSVLVGNYEFYYLCGLLKKLYGLDINKDMEPMELIDRVLPALEAVTPQNDEEDYLLRLVSVYEPSQAYDIQMKELFSWGAEEPDLWKVTTSHSGEEFVG